MPSQRDWAARVPYVIAQSKRTRLTPPAPSRFASSARRVLPVRPNRP